MSSRRSHRNRPGTGSRASSLASIPETSVYGAPLGKSRPSSSASSSSSTLSTSSSHSPNSSAWSSHLPPKSASPLNSPLTFSRPPGSTAAKKVDVQANYRARYAQYLASILNISLDAALTEADRQLATQKRCHQCSEAEVRMDE